MADFCPVCSKQMFGDVKPDIDVMKIFKGLKKKNFMPVLCEGCGMNGIMKDERGLLKVHYTEDSSDIWHDYDEEVLIKRFDEAVVSNSQVSKHKMQINYKDKKDGE